jgi:hypothetical protein
MRSALAVLLLVAFVLFGCQATLDGEDAVADWLEAMSAESEDRGWGFLDPMAQDRYEGGRSAYVSDASAVAWDRFTWRIVDSVEDDGIWTVFVGVDGGWAAVPDFIRDHQLVAVHCSDGRAIGFVAIVSQPTLAGPQLGAGADLTDTSCD